MNIQIIAPVIDIHLTDQITVTVGTESFRAALYWNDDLGYYYVRNDVKGENRFKLEWVSALLVNKSGLSLKIDLPR